MGHDRVERIARRVCRAILGSCPDLLHDAVQEVHLRVWRASSVPIGRGRFAAWVAKIARNVSIDIRHGRTHERRLEELSGEEQSHEREPTERSTLQDEIAHIRRLLPQILDPLELRAVQLRYFFGGARTVVEVATILEIPRTTASVLLLTALGKIKRHMSDNDGGTRQ